MRVRGESSSFPKKRCMYTLNQAYSRLSSAVVRRAFMQPLLAQVKQKPGPVGSFSILDPTWDDWIPLTIDDYCNHNIQVFLHRIVVSLKPSQYLRSSLQKGCLTFRVALNPLVDHHFPSFGHLEGPIFRQTELSHLSLWPTAAPPARDWQPFFCRRKNVKRGEKPPPQKP